MFDESHPLNHDIKVEDPNIDHLKKEDYEFVYEPAEDTFLLMEGLERDLNALRFLLPQTPTILEIGSGSGLVSSFAHRLLAAAPPVDANCAGASSSTTFKPSTFAVDINPHAVAATISTLERNATPGVVRQSDLATAVAEEVQGKVDVLLFNHPYVPSEPDDDKDELAKSYCGGPKGRDVLDRLLPSIPALLSPQGVFYVVFLYPHNDIAELATLMSNIGFTGRVVVARRAGIESLAILRYARPATEALLPPVLRAALPPATEAGILSIDTRDRGVVVKHEAEVERTHMKVDFEVDEDNAFNLFD